MRKKLLLIVPAAVIAFGGQGAAAQQTQQGDTGDLLDATCGQYLQAARAADPGERPSRQRRREAEAAQDSLVDAMLWVHGYTTGLTGASQAPAPLTREWIVEHIRRLAQTCQSQSPDGSMRLVDAARQL